MKHSLIPEYQVHFDTLFVDFLKEKYNLMPADPEQPVTMCEPVQKAFRYAAGELDKAEAIPLHILGMASAIAAGPK